MTMMKAWYGLIWPFLGDEFNHCHDLTSEAQKKMIPKVWCMHKSHEGVVLIIEALWREIVQMWIEKGKEELNGDFYATWVDTWVGRFIYFGTLILLFREGVRSNDFTKMHAARIAFLPMWWTNSHTIYREVVPSFIRDYALMPNVLKEKIQMWMCGTNTGNESKYQGLDFVGEELNKMLLNVVKNSPTFEDWKEAVRILTLSKSLQEKLKEYAYPTSSSNSSMGDRHIAEFARFRHAIRRKLVLETPTTLSGKKCDYPDVFETAESNMEEFLKKYLLKWEPFGDTKEQYNSFFKDPSRKRGTKKEEETEEEEREE
jgi:hypothetical protein